MPAVYAHQRFGDLVFDRLPEHLQAAFTPYKESFYLGLEGPDILFYHKPFKSNATREKALTIHLLSAKDFFAQSAKRILANKELSYPLSSPLAAYVAGFICHFCLDNACHPSVYELEFTGVSHGLIESEFDKFLLIKDRGKAFGFNPALRILNKKGVALASATALSVRESEIKRAIATIRFINGAFTCRVRLLHKLIHLFLRKIGKDDSYGGMFIHHDDHPQAQETAKKMLVELENAVTPTASLIANYFDNLETIVQTGVVNDEFDKNYTGGILDEFNQPTCR